MFVLPCTNPDGLDHVVEWYRETVGTPHEASSMTKLYQYYTGHDNNRDWFMLTQKETQAMTLYSKIINSVGYCQLRNNDPREIRKIFADYAERETNRLDKLGKVTASIIHLWNRGSISDFCHVSMTDFTINIGLFNVDLVRE